MSSPGGTASHGLLPGGECGGGSGGWESVTDTQTLACGTKAKNTPSGLPSSEPEIDCLPPEIPEGVVGDTISQCTQETRYQGSLFERLNSPTMGFSCA